jgi:RNA polymerase sigma-70 factor (ECF subfamily)
LAVARSALAAAPRARSTALALVNGSPALVMAPLGQLSLVIQFTFSGPTITAIHITAAPDRLQTFDITLA